LEGVQVYAQDATKVNFAQTITILSAIDVVILEGDQLSDMNKVCELAFP
jgi:hypothetical protein